MEFTKKDTNTIYFMTKDLNSNRWEIINNYTRRDREIDRQTDIATTTFNQHQGKFSDFFYIDNISAFEDAAIV